MKEFVKPIIAECEDLTEGIYAASGYDPIVPPEVPPPTPVNEWNIRCEYRNHNSGSHSEVAIIGNNYSSSSGEGLLMTFQIRGFRLDTIKDSSGYDVSNVSETGFTIFRRGHFNPGERVEFNIHITCKDSPYHGSVGKTGEYIPCNITCISCIPC